MKNQTFNTLMDNIKDLHAAKNHDYADENNPYSNFEFAAKLVEQFTDPVDQVFAAIIGIKIARLGQLSSGKLPNFESRYDTQIDLPTYCGIWTAYITDRDRAEQFETLATLREDNKNENPNNKNS